MTSMAEVNEQIERIVTRDAASGAVVEMNCKFFAIIARLATIGESFDLNQLSDDHLIEVPAEVIKAADRAYREHVGEV